MNKKHSLYRSDLRPLEFALVVVAGGVGSALLSALHQNSWLSVGFALVVMGTISFLRWRIASNFKDYHSLEAFAEDIYLLGYLLTLASLLGLVPRLMMEETNLFHIAGVKLLTTICGLGVMMIFRQTARRWAEDAGTEEVDKFVKQEEMFRAAVARLNQSAGELTGKMEEVALRFDPDLIGPVADWSNRAANAFSSATRAFEVVPASVETGIHRLNELSSNLERVKTAVADLATALTTNVGSAASDFAKELGQAGLSARALGVTIATLQPATDAGRSALEKLGVQTLEEIKRFEAINLSLGRIAMELGKVEVAMKKLAVEDTKDMSAPVNRLVHALEAAADRATTTADQMEDVKKELKGVSSASQELGNRLGTELGKPLGAHADTLQRVHQQLATTAQQIERVAQQMEGATPNRSAGDGFDGKLVSELSDLRKAMGESNTQLKALISRIDGEGVADHKPRVSLRLSGGGSSGSDNT